MIWIDSDAFVYRIGFGCKDEEQYDFLDVVNILDMTIKGVTSKFENQEYTLVISNTNETFRHLIAKTLPYKGNRKAEKPRFYNELREYFVDQWKATMAPDGIEADDYIGINTNRRTDIICSVDKDLLMIPAKGHYNFVKEQMVKVRRPAYYFWRQMLVGDPADNIKCVTGIGDVKAGKLLDHLKTKEMRKVVEKEYQREFGDKWFERFDENAKLLWILRHLNKQYSDYV